MRVFRVYRIIDKDLVADDPLPARCGFTIGDVVGPLTNMRALDGASTSWTLELLLAAENKKQHVTLPLEPFVLESELRASADAPLCFHDLKAVGDSPNGSSLKPGRWLWLFRSGIYVTERPVRQSEAEEVALAIRARHHRSDEQLKRLRAEVANFEALDRVRQGSSGRKVLRDDVKLLVWARDEGRCIGCHADRELQFDHIIPLTRGGSDEADNIQLLCRTCNLAKSNRLA